MFWDRRLVRVDGVLITCQIEGHLILNVGVRVHGGVADLAALGIPISAQRQGGNYAVTIHPRILHASNQH